jgi:hypothetical protein
MNKQGKLVFCIFLLGLFLLCIVLLPALGNREKDTIQERRLVQVTGIVRLVGSHPFYELVISDEEGQWYVSGDEMHKLHDLQHRTVTVEGEETVTELKFANGLSAGKRHDLCNIKIITVY